MDQRGQGDEQGPANLPDELASAASVDTPGVSLARRRALMLGAAGVAAAITVRPAYAQTAVSAFNCSIPVPGPEAGGQFIALDGSLVPPGTEGAVGGGRTFSGEDVRRALSGYGLPGTNDAQNTAYTNYIRRLSGGQSGFTCFASIQTPR